MGDDDRPNYQLHGKLVHDEKRSILIGSLSGVNLAILTAETDRP